MKFLWLTRISPAHGTSLQALTRRRKNSSALNLASCLLLLGLDSPTLAQTPLPQTLLPQTQENQTKDAATVMFEIVGARAKSLAQEDYHPATTELPKPLLEMGYEQYRAINYKQENALWRGQSLFEIQFFHPGFLYRETVPINIMSLDGISSHFGFDSDFFTFYKPADSLAKASSKDLGYAGLRVHYPINDAENKEEIMVFLGASYFRMIGPGHVYGLSARGLAVNTADSSGEEFPSFREFWLLQPQADSTHMTLIALLDSPSISGVYRFDIHPGTDTTTQVDVRLFARKDINKVGLAPLTSMFHHGENHSKRYDDFRPEVHDSDGLLMQTSQGEWIWRPLDNPKSLRITSLLDSNPRGYGLLQRDRKFTSYLDIEAEYSRRPSLWVEPQGDWGEGRVELVEIPTDTETNDNIVAYWVPNQSFKAGQERSYSYRLRTFDAALPEQNVARVFRTRIGHAALPGQSQAPPESQRQFIVDFKGGELNKLSVHLKLDANLQVSQGKASHVVVTPLPNQQGWRAAFTLSPDGGEAVDMRLFISLRDQRLTEVWNYVWSPNALQ